MHVVINRNFTYMENETVSDFYNHEIAIHEGLYDPFPLLLIKFSEELIYVVPFNGMNYYSTDTLMPSIYNITLYHVYEQNDDYIVGGIYDMDVSTKFSKLWKERWESAHYRVKNNYIEISYNDFQSRMTRQESVKELFNNSIKYEPEFISLVYSKEVEELEFKDLRILD